MNEGKEGRPDKDVNVPGPIFMFTFRVRTRNRKKRKVATKIGSVASKHSYVLLEVGGSGSRQDQGRTGFRWVTHGEPRSPGIHRYRRKPSFLGSSWFVLDREWCPVNRSYQTPTPQLEFHLFRKTEMPEKWDTSPQIGLVSVQPRVPFPGPTSRDCHYDRWTRGKGVTFLYGLTGTMENPTGETEVKVFDVGKDCLT